MYVAKKTNSDSNNKYQDSGSATPFIDAKTAVEAFNESNKWFRPYFDPMEELERLARNRPSNSIDPQLPRVTDGTMAAIVQEQPKRIIQQLASGKVDCNDYPEYAKIADLVHRYKLLPMYNRMGTALQKHWNMLGKAMTWGRSASYTFFTSTNGILHTDFVIPYVKDVISEKGKVYAPDSNIGFMRSWYQGRDITAIINREKWLEANVKGYKSDWNLSLLSQFKNEGGTSKPADLQTPAEKEKGGDAGGFEVIHAFQVGKNAEFYSFSPRFKDGDNLRTKINKDPRGKMPLDFEYCNIDLSNPLGRGQVELSGGIQNLIDQQMQMFQFLTTLLMGPPLQVWGNPNKASLKFRPNALWDMGQNNNNRVEPYNVSNHAIQQFANNYGLLKSQIFNLNSAQDHSISAEAAPTQSKTQAGVQAQENRLGVSDNYLRKQHETWFNDQAETSINIYFAEMIAPETIKLEKDDLKDIAKTEAVKYIDKKGVLNIPFDKINDVSFKFEVDASSSEIKEDLDNADKLTAVLALVQKSQDQTVRQTEAKITKLLIDEIGAEGTDDLFPEEVDENGNPIPQNPAADPQAMMQQMMPMIQQMVAEMLKQSQANKAEDPTLALIKALNLKFEQLPEAARQIVLEHTGLGTGDPTPQDRKDDLETLDALNRADPLERPPQPQQQLTTGKPETSTNSQQSQPDPMSDALNPDEQAFASALFQRGFSEMDVEQAIVMKRQGRQLPEIIKVLGAKYVQS